MPELRDNSPCGLVDLLCERINSVLSPSYWQKAEFGNEEWRSPVVYAQYLPVVKTDQERDALYPVVLVTCQEGSLTAFTKTLASTVNIRIYFGGWDAETDRQGWRIPTMMKWAVMQNLLTKKSIGAYVLDAPVKWTVLDSKEPPYYWAQLDLIYNGAPPAVEVVNEQVTLNGNK